MGCLYNHNLHVCGLDKYLCRCGKLCYITAVGLHVSLLLIRSDQKRKENKSQQLNYHKRAFDSASWQPCLLVNTGWRQLWWEVKRQNLVSAASLSTREWKERGETEMEREKRLSRWSLAKALRCQMKANHIRAPWEMGAVCPWGPWSFIWFKIHNVSAANRICREQLKVPWKTHTHTHIYILHSEVRL